ncbi:MAG: DUF4263 domain-containing protein [Acidobacteriia bacterium]|nr:DUF4263 domain-containing protein [Terriglobia bacterium]
MINRMIDFSSHLDRKGFESDSKATWGQSFFDTVEDLKSLLSRRPPEQRLQQFFESHPYLLPGIDALHNGPLAGIVATKFCLGNSFQTDFSFVSANSQELRITCVEIESPRKSIFRKDGEFSRDYLMAKQQILDWMFWAHHNVKQALDCWGPLMGGRVRRLHTIYFGGYLVFGRRAEIDNPKKQERWSAEDLTLARGLSTMTYDRLLDWREGRWIPKIRYGKIAVCSYKDRRFIAKKLCI